MVLIILPYSKYQWITNICTLVSRICFSKKEIQFFKNFFDLHEDSKISLKFGIYRLIMTKFAKNYPLIASTVYVRATIRELPSNQQLHKIKLNYLKKKFK